MSPGEIVLLAGLAGLAGWLIQRSSMLQARAGYLRGRADEIEAMTRYELGSPQYVRFVYEQLVEAVGAEEAERMIGHRLEKET